MVPEMTNWKCLTKSCILSNMVLHIAKSNLDTLSLFFNTLFRLKVRQAQLHFL